MPKNIVLCADGTGNRGGVTPDSNVYKIYTYTELNNPDDQQVKLYDNGVGTSTNKIWRLVTGAIGVGFRENVCELYRFLARSYEPGDRIYLFGFSRGAATVRAFSGFVATCGLFKGAEQVHEAQLREYTYNAYRAYRAARNGQPERAKQLRENEGQSHGVVPIEMIGVWDTVAALGLPTDFRIFGITIWALNFLLYLLERILDLFFPHRFFELELTDNVKNAFQALAIDDERQSFLPLIWDERASPQTHVEQVWFAGAHSNVGGGYGRRGLSSVALDWMMEKAEKLHLTFESGAREEVRNEANAHGRLFDSRSGFAMYYRYQARDITELSAGKLRARIKIHQSVMDRVQQRTGNYAPGLLPYEAEIVETVTPESSARARPEVTIDEARQAQRDRVVRWTNRRAWLYNLILEVTLWVGVAAIYFWVNPPEIPEPTTELGLGILESWPHLIFEIVEYFLPKALEGLAIFLLFEWSWYGSLALATALVSALFGLDSWTRNGELAAREDARKAIHVALRKSD